MQVTSNWDEIGSNRRRMGINTGSSLVLCFVMSAPLPIRPPAEIFASSSSGAVLVRHEGQTARERSTCGWRDRLISHEDIPLAPAAWAHAVDIDGAKLHFHKRSTELYYVLEGAGTVSLDGVEHAVTKGSLLHIPPGVVHGAKGQMRVLVVGIPDISDDDFYEVLAGEG